MKISSIFCEKITLHNTSNSSAKELCITNWEISSGTDIFTLQELDIKIGISCSVASYFSNRCEVNVGRRWRVLVNHFRKDLEVSKAQLYLWLVWQERTRQNWGMLQIFSVYYYLIVYFHYPFENNTKLMKWMLLLASWSYSWPIQLKGSQRLT